MSDREVRELERLAATGDPGALARLDRALERSGAFARVDAELDRALDEVQRDGPGGPCRSTLHRLEVAGALRDLGGEGARLVLADPAPRGDADVRTFVVLRLEAEEVVLALGRAAPEALSRAMARGGPVDLATLRRASEAGRFLAVSLRRTIAQAWARQAPEGDQRLLRSVRVRPAMYFGSADARGLQNAIERVFELGFDEARAGEATELSVTLHADGSCTVRDDGRPLEERSAEGLEGGTLSIVAAASDWLELDSIGGGRARTRRFERGYPTGESERAEQGRGLVVRFRLDRSIFAGEAGLRFERLCRRAREVAYLLPGLRLSVTDEATGAAASFMEPDGLAAWMRCVVGEDAPLLHGHGHRARPEVQAEVALTWVADARALERPFREQQSLVPWRPRGPRWVGFVNAEVTSRGGAHTDGLLRGAEQGFQALGVDTDHAAFGEGLLGVASIFVPDPQLQGSTRDRLAAPDVRPFVASLVSSAVRAWARDDRHGFEALKKVWGVDPRRARGRRRR